MADYIAQLECNSTIPRLAAPTTTQQPYHVEVPPGITDIVTALYYQVLKHQPDDVIAFMALYLEEMVKKRTWDPTNFQISTQAGNTSSNNPSGRSVNFDEDFFVKDSPREEEESETVTP